MNFLLNILNFKLQWSLIFCTIVALLGFAVGPTLDAQVKELQRREARVQATYLTHLINFTMWSEEHLPREGKPPTILVLGNESNGFIASLRYLATQSGLKIGGQSPKFIHLKRSEAKLAQSILRKGCQFVFVMSNSSYKPKQINSLSKGAVVMGQGRIFVTKLKGDVSFIVAKNRVKIVVSESYFRRTSPKLSSKLANLKSVVEIFSEADKLEE